MSISSATQFAAYGMGRAVHRFENAAQNIAKAPNQEMDGPEASGDIVTAFVETISAKHAFEANLSTFRTADEMMGKVLNLKA